LKRIDGLIGGLLIALTLVSCGGGGGGGNGGGTSTEPPPPTTGIVFTPAGGGGTGISLASSSASFGSTLVLDVRSSGIQDLYGVAFHLTYPNTAMKYVGATEGTVLNATGIATSFLIIESPPGTLNVGLTRLGTVSGTSAAGALMMLQFSAVATGTGSLAFGGDVAINSTMQTISGVTWSAGSVQVNVIPGSKKR
jgi:hypothetical protein